VWIHLVPAHIKRACQFFYCRPYQISDQIRGAAVLGLVISVLNQARSARSPLVFLSVRGRRSRGWFLDSSVPLSFCSVTAPKVLLLAGSVFLLSSITVQAQFA
jgi:hypothetical protein